MKFLEEHLSTDYYKIVKIKNRPYVQKIKRNIQMVIDEDLWKSYLLEFYSTSICIMTFLTTFKTCYNFLFICKCFRINIFTSSNFIISMFFNIFICIIFGNIYLQSLINKDSWSKPYLLLFIHYFTASNFSSNEDEFRYFHFFLYFYFHS